MGLILYSLSGGIPSMHSLKFTYIYTIKTQLSYLVLGQVDGPEGPVLEPDADVVLRDGVALSDAEVLGPRDLGLSANLNL